MASCAGVPPSPSPNPLVSERSPDDLTRGDLRLLAQLARQPGWFQELPDGVRRGVMIKLIAVLNKPDMRTRELVSVAKVMASLEKNDLERGKLLVRVAIEEEDDGVDG
jgi:hypothetical protein